MANNTNWLNISSQSGSSGQTILTLSAQRNLSTDYKTAEITAYNPVYNISAKTYVTLESYAPYLTIDPALVGVPGSGGTYELHISANCSWVIAFPDLVSTYSTSAGSGNASITFTVPSTTADTTLVANIVVTDESGQISRICRIEQYGAGVHIGIYPVELYFDSTGGSKTFTVTADCAYNVRMESGTTWATVEPQSGYTGQTVFTVTVNEENTGSTVRQGAVFIDAPGSDLAVILYQRKSETRVVVGYYVTSTTNPTTICYDTSSFSGAEYPDGTEITLGTGYTFPSTGMQYVYYTLTGTSIGDYAFHNIEQMRSVVVPNGVTSLGKYCFNMSLYLSSVTLPSTLESIGNGCFEACYHLSSITIPSSVTSIGNNAFSYCLLSLSSVTLESGLTQIGNYCFSYCEALSSITIPGSVLSIGRDCFTGSSVSSITFTSLTPPYLENTNALSSTSLFEIIVPCLAVEAYLSAWPQYSEYITCNDDTVLYFTTDTSNVAGTGETRTITILNNNVNPNRIGLSLPSDFPQQGSYIVDGNVIYLTYPANPSYTTSRTWTIGVVAQTVDGVSLSGSYTITQVANLSYSITYTADTSIVDASGETRTITIDRTNLIESSITISVEGATGVTYTYQNGVITITFPENTGFGQYVTVSINASTTNGYGASAVVNYVQDGEYIIPTGDSRLIVIYNVTSTTNDTPILYNTGNTNSFSKAELNGSSSITMNSSYRFKRTGRQAIFYTLKNNVLGRNINNSANLVRGDFYGVESITAVYVPSSVTEIHTGCFGGCANMSSITIPDSVTTICGFSFSNCSSLSGITLPNNLTKIGSDCFSDCSSLTSITVPDAVTYVGGSCFINCTSLASAIIGSGVTYLGDSDYQTEEAANYTGGDTYIFCGCTSLASVTIRGAVTKICNYCFKDCISLRNIGFLPSTVERIGSAAFSGCVSLSSVTLPLSTTFIGDACFSGCTALTNVHLNSNIKYIGHSPNLASNLGQIPDGGVFSGCAINSSVEFPASLKGIGANSFKGCSEITSMTFNGGTPPTIKKGSTSSSGANSLGFVSYTFPFYVPCGSLSEYETAFGDLYSRRIQCYTIIATSITLDVANEIIDSGLATVSILPYGSTTDISFSSSDSSIATINSDGQISVLANGQISICATDSISNLSDCKTVSMVKTDPRQEYLTFEIISGGSIVWKDTNSATTIEYSKNGGGWNSLRPNYAIMGLVAGDKVRFRANGVTRYCSFGGGSATYNVSGNISSLISKTNFSSITSVSASGFTSFFSGEKVISAKSLILPATTLANRCYEGMFAGCRSLTTAPELPATTLANYCYSSMFANCISLTTAPELPATTLASNCYTYMFSICRSLTGGVTTIGNSATTMADGACSRMFEGCRSLTTAPELPATTLANYCYFYMFDGCSSLSSVTCLATDISASYCTSGWVTGVQTTSGRFVKAASMSSWTTGVNGIPTNWTVQDAT